MTHCKIAKDIQAMKQLTKNIRQKTYRRSSLDAFNCIILRYYQNGASLAEIHRWLQVEQNVTVAYSTLYRWVKKNAQV